MKNSTTKLGIALIAVCFLASNVSYANNGRQSQNQQQTHNKNNSSQNNHNKNNHEKNSHNNNKDNNRGKNKPSRQNNHNQSQKHAYKERDRFAWNGQDFRKGHAAPENFRGNGYKINDWRERGLRQPPSGYHWSHINGNYVLLAAATGVIAAIVYEGMQ